MSRDQPSAVLKATIRTGSSYCPSSRSCISFVRLASVSSVSRPDPAENPKMVQHEVDVAVGIFGHDQRGMGYHATLQRRSASRDSLLHYVRSIHYVRSRCVGVRRVRAGWPMIPPIALVVKSLRIAVWPSTEAAYWNATPISASLCHTRRQGRLVPSNGNASVKRSGTAHGLTMSNAAPVSESLRTKHKTALP